MSPVPFKWSGPSVPLIVAIADASNAIERAPMKPLERVMGIEPTYSAWKAAALPLSYTRAAPL